MITTAENLAKGDVTSGTYATEEEAAADFDARIEASGLFKCYVEVDGCQVQPRLRAEYKQVRIDRILIPAPPLLKANWSNGIIGVEIKTSGKKLGPVLSQCMDYSRTIWQLPMGRLEVCATWIMLWPCERVGGALESVMVQHRVGQAYPTNNGLCFKVGGTSMLHTGIPGDRIDWKPIRGGGKAGSR